MQTILKIYCKNKYAVFEKYYLLKQKKVYSLLYGWFISLLGHLLKFNDETPARLAVHMTKAFVDPPIYPNFYYSSATFSIGYIHYGKAHFCFNGLTQC